MKKCTQIDKVSSTNKNFSQIDKPLVSILLAVYKPNEKWTEEEDAQLEKEYRNNKTRSNTAELIKNIINKKGSLFDFEINNIMK